MLLAIKEPPCIQKAEYGEAFCGFVFNAYTKIFKICV